MSEFAVTDIEACPVCGATGPCSLDESGRPLVHTDAQVKQ
jgi:hypothetical protein